MIRLAGIAAVTVTLTAACFGDGKANDAAQYRHYFNIGKRACRVGETTTQTAHGVQSQVRQVVTTGIDLRKYPVKYRKAVDAGCRAD